MLGHCLSCDRVLHLRVRAGNWFLARLAINLEAEEASLQLDLGLAKNARWKALVALLLLGWRFHWLLCLGSGCAVVSHRGRQREACYQIDTWASAWTGDRYTGFGMDEG